MKLPLNCEVTYHKEFLTEEEAKTIFNIIINEYRIPSLNKMYVKEQEVELNTGKIMFVDDYILKQGEWRHSTHTATWFKELDAVRKKVEALTDSVFHTCVCIYYPDGNSGVAYHFDPPAFGDTTIIPSLSLGEERDFYLREKSTQKEFCINLKEGSLIIMGEGCQERYEHSLPENPKYKQPRINITFRQYGF